MTEKWWDWDQFFADGMDFESEYMLALKPLLDKLFYAYGIRSDDKTFQKNKKVDMWAQINEHGKKLLLEVKGQKYAWGSFWLETWTCTVPGHENYGWMKTSEADILVYVFKISDDSWDVYILPFKKLQKWFWLVYEKYEEKYTSEYNRTAGRIVPISEVGKAGISMDHFVIDGESLARRS